MLACAGREGLQLPSQSQTWLSLGTRLNTAGWKISLLCPTVSNWAIANTHVGI